MYNFVKRVDLVLNILITTKNAKKNKIIFFRIKIEVVYTSQKK